MTEPSVQERIALAREKQADAPEAAQAVQEKQQAAAPEQVEVEVPDAIEYHQYFCNLKAFKMILANGTILRFTEHRYITCNPDAIEYLDSEVSRQRSLGRPPRIFTKPGEETIMSDELDPMSAMEKRIRAKVYAELGVKVVATPNSVSKPGAFMPASTRDIAAITGGSVSNT